MTSPLIPLFEGGNKFMLKLDYIFVTDILKKYTQTGGYFSHYLISYEEKKLQSKWRLTMIPLKNNSRLKEKLLILCSLCLFFFLLMPNDGYSQMNKKPVTDPTTGGIIYLGIPYSFYDQNTAESEGIRSEGFGFSLGFSLLFFKNFLIGLEYGGDIPVDKKKFTNQTTAGELESGIYINQFSLYTGLKSPGVALSENSESQMFGNLYVGNMWAFLEGRSIGNCIDCDEEDIDINGGMFVEPEIYYAYSGFGLGLSYRYFFNSDYQGKITFKLSALIFE